MGEEVMLFRWEAFDFTKRQVHVSCPKCFALSKHLIEQTKGTDVTCSCGFSAAIAYNGEALEQYDAFMGIHPHPGTEPAVEVNPEKRVEIADVVDEARYAERIQRDMVEKDSAFRKVWLGDWHTEELEWSVVEIRFNVEQLMTRLLCPHCGNASAFPVSQLVDWREDRLPERYAIQCNVCWMVSLGPNYSVRDWLDQKEVQAKGIFTGIDWDRKTNAGHEAARRLFREFEAELERFGVHYKGQRGPFCGVLQEALNRAGVVLVTHEYFESLDQSDVRCSQQAVELDRVALDELNLSPEVVEQIQKRMVVAEAAVVQELQCVPGSQIFPSGRDRK